MYHLALYAHSYVRWVVVALGLLALGRAVAGWRSRAGWRRVDERLATAFLATLDTQVLLGILLWCLWSPFAMAFRDDPRAAMHDAPVRFWGMEHQVSMVLAFVVAHVGRARGKRHGEGWARHRIQAITLLVWVALVAAAFPWPGTGHARPLLRMPF